MGVCCCPPSSLLSQPPPRPPPGPVLLVCLFRTFASLFNLDLTPSQPHHLLLLLTLHTSARTLSSQTRGETAPYLRQRECPFLPQAAAALQTRDLMGLPVSDSTEYSYFKDRFVKQTKICPLNETSKNAIYHHHNLMWERTFSNREEKKKKPKPFPKWSTYFQSEGWRALSQRPHLEDIWFSLFFSLVLKIDQNFAKGQCWEPLVYVTVKVESEARYSPDWETEVFGAEYDHR